MPFLRGGERKVAESFGLKIGVEGEKEFKQSLADINSQFKVLGSEMKLATSEFASNEKSVEALTAKNDVLSKQIETQKSKIETLRSALKNASESFGENDKRTQNWAVQLNNAQAELNGMERELKQNKTAIDGVGNEMSNAEKQTDKFGDELEDTANQSDDASKKFESLSSVCKGVAVAMTAVFAAVSAAAISAGKALVNMTEEGAKYADSVLTESAVTGIATDKLQEYMYAAELVDVSTETLTGSMAKNIKSMKSAADGSSTYAEVYEKLGVAVTDANGELRDSNDVYWDLIDALGKIENDTERDALAMTVLGKSAQELNPLIIAGSERMEELGEEARKAGYVVSGDMLNAYGKLDDEMQRLTSGTTAAKNALGTVLLPVLTNLAGEGVELLGEFTNGILNANGDIGKMSDVIGAVLPKALDAIMQYVPELLQVITEVIGSVGKAIINNLPSIIDSATQIVFSIVSGILSAMPEVTKGALQLISTLTKGLLSNLPKIVAVAVQMVASLVKGIANALPTLIPTIVKTVMLIVETLLGNMDLILDASLQLITGLAQGLLDAIPVLIDALPEVINSIIDFLLNSIPQIIQTGIQLLTSLVSALPEIITAIVNAIPQIIDGIISAVVDSIPLIIQAGIDLLVSLIQALPEIIITIVNAIPQIIDGIVNGLLGNLDKIIMAGVELFVAIIQNLPTIIVEIVKAVPQIIEGIVKAFGSLVGEMANIGMNLVKGLWQGIQSLASWIWDKVSSWASDLWDGICSFFGIHSPSTKMKWVGDMMMKGLAGGIDDSASEVLSSATDMTNDLNSVFNDLSADLSTTLPNSIDINKNITTGMMAEKNNGASGFVLNLNISNFNNYRTEDITELTNEIMNTAGAFINRKKVVLG